MAHKPHLSFDVSSLASLSAEALRIEWRKQASGEPPLLRAPELLRRELAWRLDARVNGYIVPTP